MKIVEKLTQRLDHMVPDKPRRNVDQKEIESFLKSMADAEKRLGKKQK